jgi:hypothetical protein
MSVSPRRLVLGMNHGDKIKNEVPLGRLELPLLAPGANALSTELQGHKDFYFTTDYFSPNPHTGIWKNQALIRGLIWMSSARS